MAGEIATAYVRIRPNMTGFKSETEAGARSAFSGIAKIVGIALGGAAAFEFGKNVVEGAADTQKQVEGVRQEFGRASGAVLKFGENAAGSLAISKNAADTAAVRFGLLFRNLGIGQSAAATMTIRLEQLAGSIATIRNIKPETVLQTLPLALAGNVRGLKQLGLGIDQSQVKIAAFKLGLISSLKDGLTPAIRAQAIYALATAKLGVFQAQAASHSHDLANVQARLSAEWKNAKDALGTALLPALTQVATALEHWLTRMSRSGALQRDFNAIAKVTVTIIHAVLGALTAGEHVWQAFSSAVGGTKHALILLFAILTVEKIRKVAQSIVSDLVTNGLKVVQAQAKTTGNVYEGSMSKMKLATIGLRDTIRTALISTAIGALVVAIGLATTYVITHWDTVRKYTVATVAAIAGTWHGLQEVLNGVAVEIGASLTAALSAPIVGLAKVAATAFGWVPFIGGKIKSAAKSVEGFAALTGQTLAGAAKQVQQGYKDIGKGAAQNWVSALRDGVGSPNSAAALKKAGKDAGKIVGDALSSTGASGVTNLTKALGAAMANAIAKSNQRIANSVSAAKNNLDSIGGKLAATINRILQKLGGVGGAIAGSPQAQAFKKLKDLVAAGAPSFAIARANQALSTQLQGVGKTQAELVKQQIADLTDSFNQGNIPLKSFNAQLTGLLQKSGANFKTAGKTGGKAFADAFRAEVAGLRAQAQAIAALPARLRGIGGGGGAADIKIIRPLEVMRVENARIAALAARQRERIAKANEKTNTLLTQIKGTNVGPLPGHGNKPKGKAAKKATVAAVGGIQP